MANDFTDNRRMECPCTFVLQGRYNSPRLRRSAIYRALRTESAAMVSVGFFSEKVVKQLPSTTNRFLTSCAWQYEFSTDFFESLPIRTVPVSWLAKPPGASL